MGVCTPITSSARKLQQDDCFEFETSLGYKERLGKMITKQR